MEQSASNVVRTDTGSAARAGRADVVRSIADAARRSGVDFSYMLGQARLESGLNPHARARTSSATGLYQFIDQSWLATVDRHGAEHGLEWASAAITRGPGGRYQVADAGQRAQIMALRQDPATASAMAAAHARDNHAHLAARLDRPVEPVDLYLAHFLGAAGAGQFLTRHASQPEASAAALFPAAARANRSIFYTAQGSPRTLDQVRSRFAARLAQASGAPAGGAPVSEPEAQTRFVEPADWLRVRAAAVAGANAQTAAVQQGAPGAPPSDRVGHPASAMQLASLRPQEARLAYLMLASQGALL